MTDWRQSYQIVDDDLFSFFAEVFDGLRLVLSLYRIYLFGLSNYVGFFKENLRLLRGVLIGVGCCCGCKRLKSGWS